MSMKKIMDFSRKYPFIIVLYVLLSVEFFYLLKCDFVYGKLAIDQDAAKAMTHMIEMVRNRTLLLPNWRYMTTHEIDCSVLLAIPLYVITSDVWTSFAISNLIYMVILYVVVMQIFKNLNIRKEYALATMCIIYVPFGFGMLDYLNMMFIRAAQYSFKVLLPLLAIMLLTSSELKRITQILISMAWLFLVFISSFSSGPLPIVSALIPLILGYLLNVLSESENRDRYVVTRYKSIVLIMGLVVGGIGLVFHQMTGMNAGGLDANVVLLDDFVEKIHTTITMFLYIINALPESWSASVPVVSIDGLGYVFRFALVIMLVFIGIKYIVKLTKRNVHVDLLIAAERYFIIIVIINSIVLLLSTYMAPRYFLIEIICLIFLGAFFLRDYISSFRLLQRRLLGLCFVCSIFIIWYSSTRYIDYCLIAEDKYSFCNDICAYATEQRIDNIIIIDCTEVDEICRIINPDQKVSNYSTTDNDFISYDWYTNTNKREYYGDRSIVLTRDYDDVSLIFGEETGENYRYVGEIGGFKMFQSDVFCLPIQ